MSNRVGGTIAVKTEDDTFKRYVKAMIYSVQNALPLLTKGTSIILAGSSASIESWAAFSAYSATKAIVCNLAHRWAIILKGIVIRANVLSPDPIRAPFLFDFACNDPKQQHGMLDYLSIRISLVGFVSLIRLLKLRSSLLAKTQVSYMAPIRLRMVARHNSELRVL